MPFKSEKQKRYMFSQHPDIANRWVAEEKAKAKKEKRMPKYVVAKSAFGVEHAAIDKALGGPKVKGQAVWTHSDKNGERKTFAPQDAKVTYKGKSLILRRPKYVVSVVPSKKNLKQSTGISDAKNFTMSREGREGIHQAYLKGDKEFKYDSKVSKAGLTPLFRLGAAGTKEANAAAGGVRAATGAKDMSAVDTSAKSIMDSVRRAKPKSAQPQKPPGTDLVPVGGARTKAEPIQRKPGKTPGKEVVPAGKPYTPASKDLVPAAGRSVAPTAGRGEVIQGRVVGRNQGPRKPYEQGPQKVRRQFKLDVKNPFAGKQIKNPLSGKFKLKTNSGTSAPKSFKDTKANSVDAALIGGGVVGASVLGASAMNNRNKVSKRYLTYSNNDWR